MVSPNPSAFFEAVYLSFQHACHTAPVINRYFQIAGYTILLRFAGSSLIPSITPALEHVAIDAAPPSVDLTICLWDSATTNAPLLDELGKVSWMVNSRRGEFLNYSDNRYQTAMQVDAGILNVYDKERNLALSWIRQPELSLFKMAAPCQDIFHWWLRERKLLMVHGAAVGLEMGAALIVGNSGAGKSTTALVCAHAGMKYLADDRCVLALNPEPHVFALYNSGKILPNQLSLFPCFKHGINRPKIADNEKALMFLQRALPDQVARDLPLAVILLARLSYQKATSISPVKPMKVCQTLAGSTMIYTPGWSQEDLKGSSRLVLSAPCYMINLGTDIWQIPEVISQQIIDELNKK